MREYIIIQYLLDGSISQRPRRRAAENSSSSSSERPSLSADTKSGLARGEKRSFSPPPSTPPDPSRGANRAAGRGESSVLGLFLCQQHFSFFVDAYFVACTCDIQHECAILQRSAPATNQCTNRNACTIPSSSLEKVSGLLPVEADGGSFGLGVTLC